MTDADSTLDADSPSQQASLIEAAPKVKGKPSYFLMALTLALLGFSPLPLLWHWPMGTAIAWILPILTFVGLMTHSNRIDKILSSKYATAVLKRHGKSLEDKVDHEALKAAYSNKSALSNAQTLAILFFIFYLSYFYIKMTWRDLPRVDPDWFDITVRIGQSAALVVLALISSVSFAGATKTQEFNFSEDESLANSLELPREDRNDIDIAGLGLAMHTLMRRAESYTVESTLLSALAFSAFVGIAFSDQGPIESWSWIAKSIGDGKCAAYPFILGHECYKMISTAASNHIMFLVSSLLLLTSVFFISTLIIRFRFNEAYKYSEEILSLCQILNQKETSAPSHRKIFITAEIDRALERAASSIDDLKPLGNAMKIFRNFGVLFFVLSVSLCGLYFHAVFFTALLAIIASAYAMTYIDNFRRKSNFLPKIEDLALSIWHKRV